MYNIKGMFICVLVFKSIIKILINSNKQLIPKNNIVNREEDW